MQNLFIEDLIEIVMGNVHKVPHILCNYGPLRLKNYNVRAPYIVMTNYFDLNALANMKIQAKDHDNGYTESQRKLIITIIHKYRKQLNEKYMLPNIHEYLHNPVWKYELRPHHKAPRKITFEDNFFYLSFPYDKKILQRFRTIWAIGNLPGTNRWDVSKQAWQVSNSLAGKELIEKTIETVGGEFDISPKVLKKLNDKTVNIVCGLITYKNDNLQIINSVNTLQNNLALEVINSNDNIYQKISRLAYINYKFDNTVINYLKDKSFNDWQINLLITRDVKINTRKISLTKFYSFITTLNLGFTVEYYNGRDAVKFYTEKWGDKYIEGIKYSTDTRGYCMIRTSKSSNKKIPPRPIILIDQRRFKRIEMDQLVTDNIDKQVTISSNFLPAIDIKIPLIICKQNLISSVSIRHRDQLNKFIKVITLTNKK